MHSQIIGTLKERLSGMEEALRSEILTGDCLAILLTLPAQSVRMLYYEPALLGFARLWQVCDNLMKATKFLIENLIKEK